MPSQRRGNPRECVGSRYSLKRRCYTVSIKMWPQMRCALSAVVLLRRTMADGRAASPMAVVVGTDVPRAALADSLALGYSLSPPPGVLIQRLRRTLFAVSQMAQISTYTRPIPRAHITHVAAPTQLKDMGSPGEEFQGRVVAHCHTEGLRRA